MKKKMILWIVAGIILLVLLIQLIPLPGRGHNPPVATEPKWDSPQTRQLAKRACFDCHSNETSWPWYSYVAPVSWLIYNDVMEGRAHMNFSAWDSPQEGAGEVGKVLQEGEMPPAIYLLMHPSARLTESEKQALSSGLNNSLH